MPPGANAPGMVAHAGQVKDRGQTKGDPLSLQVGGLALD